MITDSDFKIATIKFDITKGKKKKKSRIRFQIVHDLPTDIPHATIDDALANWLPRTEAYTDVEFCNYINSKTDMTGCVAYTMEEYNQICKKVVKENIGKAEIDPNNRGGTGHYDDSLSDADPGL